MTKIVLFWGLFLLVLGNPGLGVAASISVRVGQGNDDGEETVSNGNMLLTSSDLELINDSANHGGDQLVGMRFLNVGIPFGATINSAFIDFTVDETGTTATSLTIRGEDADNPAIFVTTSYNISNRTATTAAVAWNNVSAWNTVGSTQTTPDLAAIVQEIIDRGGWADGNPMVFIVTGTGRRTAESYNGVSDQAPLLRVDYSFVDTTSPAAVTDLAAGSSTSSSVLLTWTAPGDDGGNGSATNYDIRYSTSPITAGNWDSASQAGGESFPQGSGSAESFVVTGLSRNTTYYFALKTADEVPNLSDLSNVPSGSTTSGTNSFGECGVLYEEFSEAKSNNNAYTITVLQPGGTNYGDLLIAAVVVEKDNQASLSAPIGWNTIDVNQYDDKLTLGVWIKIAGASEPASYPFTWSQQEEEAYAWIMRFTGHDAANPFNAWDRQEGKSQWPTSPSVTTTVENTVILRMGGFVDDQINVDDTGLPGHISITMDHSNGGQKISGGAGYIEQAIIGPSGTSTFTLTGDKEYCNLTVAIAPDPGCSPGVSGRILEDINGDADLADGVGRSNVDVRLYRDGGDGLPSGGDDSLELTTPTQADGSYLFDTLSDGDYWVVVDSRTMTPSGGHNGGFGLTDVWAEQTFGPVGGLSDDGAGGWTELITAGACYGGRDTDRSDNASALGTAEHVAKVTVSGGGANDVDFGFSFNVIVRTDDGDDDGGANRTVQGSLRQFLQNGNSVVGENISRFAIPTHDSGYDPSGHGEYRIQPLAALPSLTDIATLNGTTQAGFAGDPLIEIDGSNAGAGVSGLTITAGSSTVRGLIINRFNGSAIRLMNQGGNTIAGNYLGPDAGGMTGGVGNFIEGVYIYDSPDNIIGGTSASDRNIISGNRLRGIWINEIDDGPGASSQGTMILGNYIGTDASGSDKLPYSLAGPTHQQIGIAFWDAIGNSIGGTSAGAGNVLSGNSWYGIYFWGPNTDKNLIQGNTIGLDATATNPVGNGWDGGSRSGIHMSNAQGNTIGGTLPGSGNIVAGNDGSGILIYGSTSTDNGILGNSIFGNVELGIDLQGDGITANDLGDGDTGSNNLQNFPILTSALCTGGTLNVQGTLNSTPNTTFRVEFFANSVLDPSGNGEGETWLGFTDVITDGSGNSTFNHNLAALVESGFFITSTATDPDNNTSEFSNGEEVVGSADVVLTMSDSDDPVASGGALLYTLLVVNNGPDTATGVTVVDNLPPSVTLQTVTVSQGTWSGTSDITCNLGAILSGGTATIEILVVTSGSGTITNTAQISASSIDIVPGNDTAIETTEVVLGGSTDIPLTLYERIHGFIDFTTTGASLRTQPNGVDPCAVTNSASATLSGIPATGTVTTAFLYWAASGSVVDVNVSLDGAPLVADRTWQSQFILGATTFDFFAGFKDVTTQVQTKGNGLYTFSDLNIDSGNPYCGSSAVLGGWSLIVIYEDPTLSGKTLVVYDGFDLERDGSTNYLLSGIYAADPPEAKTAFLVWEGDDSLGGVTESLEFNGFPQSDILNPVNNVYNGTINTLGINNSYGLDLDTFDVSGLINFGDTFATTSLLTGPDLTILNAVVLEVKTNVIAGTVFDDVNFGGGPGRDLATAVADAPGFSIGTPNATIELYDSSGNFFRSTTSSGTGDFGFTGLANGNYFVRVVNGTVKSTRGGATGSEWPIQTYRTNGSAGTAIPVITEIGGVAPLLQDDPVNSTSENLFDIGAQSVTPVLLSDAKSVTHVDFGFNFDTIVNTNDTGQGSLRQFIINSNSLENTNLDQDGLTADIESSLFEIPTSDPNYNLAGQGEFRFRPTSALPAVIDPVILDGTTHPDYVDRPIIEVDGNAISSASTHGFVIGAGESTIRRMVIHGFDTAGSHGILLETNDGNTIIGNFIGTDVTGTAASGNGTAGIGLSGSSGNIIGGDGTENPNTIAFNGGNGILVTAATGNRITGNSIHSNGQLAIDLGDDGVTVNDDGDGDSGANDLQNFPIVDSAHSDGANITISGTMNGLANTFFRLEFFANQAIDPSGYGEAEIFLGHLDVTSDGTGNVDFNISLPKPVAVGNFISATAIDPGNNTSELGGGTIVLGLPDVLLMKSVQALEDPVNSTTNAKSIPGSYMLYTITLTNQGNGPLDGDSVLVTDIVPANTAVFVQDVDVPGSGPVIFENGSTSSGLTYTFTSLDSTIDDLEFSDDGGATFDYTPVPDPTGFDDQITHLRIHPDGHFAGSDGSNHPTFYLKFKMRVE